MATPASAEWNFGTLTMESKKVGNPSGSTRYVWSGHAKGIFATRFDYDKIPLIKGRDFSGFGFLNCENSKPLEFYWNACNLSEKDQQQMINEYSIGICAELKRFYPYSPALK